MAEPGTRRTVQITWGAIARVLVAIVLVWLWLKLWSFVLVFIMAVVLAVALEPIVAWMERHRIARGWGATIVSVVLLAILVGVVVISWNALSEQGRVVSSRVASFERQVVQHAPPFVVRAFGLKSKSEIDLREYAGPFVRSTLEAVLVFVLGFILMAYLLVEGRRVYAWLVAFFPCDKQEKIHATAASAREAIFGYVAGNVATSIFAFLVVYIALLLLKVPAALLLGIIAGLCDFVPVVGFIVSATPAVLLALMVSPTVALTVAAVFVSYHFVENYFVAPKVYGDRLKLSNVAVLVAFAAGAELAGVVGALLALPFAAAYPAVERIWLRDKLGEEVVERHAKIEGRDEDLNDAA